MPPKPTLPKRLPARTRDASLQHEIGQLRLVNLRNAALLKDNETYGEEDRALLGLLNRNCATIGTLTEKLERQAGTGLDTDLAFVKAVSKARQDPLPGFEQNDTEP